MAIQVGQDVIRLLWKEKDKTVYIEPEDEDRFSKKVGEVILAARVGLDALKASRQLNVLLCELASWIHEHEGEISRAFLTVRNRGLLFLVVRKTRRLDEALEDDLTDLDLKLAGDERFALLDVGVMALPECPEPDISSFVSPELLFEYRRAG